MEPFGWSNTFGRRLYQYGGHTSKSGQRSSLIYPFECRGALSVLDCGIPYPISKWCANHVPVGWVCDMHGMLGAVAGNLPSALLLAAGHRDYCMSKAQGATGSKQAGCWAQRRAYMLCVDNAPVKGDSHRLLDRTTEPESRRTDLLNARTTCTKQSAPR